MLSSHTENKTHAFHFVKSFFSILIWFAFSFLHSLIFSERNTHKIELKGEVNFLINVNCTRTTVLREFPVVEFEYTMCSQNVGELNKQSKKKFPRVRNHHKRMHNKLYVCTVHYTPCSVYVKFYLIDKI